MVPPRFEQRDETSQGVQVALEEAFAFPEEPFIVAALHQVAPVQFEGRSQLVDATTIVACCCGGRRLERVDIEPAGQIRPPAERVRRHLEVLVEGGQGAPEGVEDVAQVRPRLRLCRVGPEEEREVLSNLGCLAMEEEVGEERFGASGLERR